ncbi:MAG: DEAD/DEAH box helicase [Clostridiaceae bacterium]
MGNVSFDSFKINSNILEAIEKLGFKNPSEVQEKVIPLILSGKDVIVKSETGSGKTASYGIPICQRVVIEEKSPQALVLTPTRELAIQVKEDIGSIGRFDKIRCEAIYGKQPMSLQIRELKQRIHVIAGTPGRLQDHIDRGTIDLSKIKYLVIDEADKMFNMGFIDQVEGILKKLPSNQITALFSATMDYEIETLTEKYMIKPVKVDISDENLTVDKIDQHYYRASLNEKFSLLLNVLYSENPDSMILFCNTKEAVDNLTSKLKDLGYPCRSIHGGMEQKDRISTMKDFKRGEFPILAATDVAARGIDIEDISHIINYDVPMEKESYVHRIGRTGRAGRGGTAISLVFPWEIKFLQQIEEYIGLKIEEKAAPDLEETEKGKTIFENKMKSKPKLKEDKSENLNSEITKLYINSGKKKKLRPGDIVGAITGIDGIEAENIGIIDILDYISYVEILNGKGELVLKELQHTPIKGKIVKVQRAKE